MSTDNFFLSKAAPAYNLGMSIIPILPGTKDPHSQLLPKTKRGAMMWRQFKIKRAEPEQIATWAEQCPNASYGIVCGLPSEINSQYLYVLDVEEKGLFQEMLQEITLQFGETQSVRTKRGGHIYLLSSSPIISQNKYRERGFELKGQGSYVVGEGCAHPDGGWYELHSSPGIFASPPNIPFCDIEPVPFQNLHENNFKLAFKIAQRIHGRALDSHYAGEGKSYNRSRAMQAIVTSCRNANIEKATVRKVIESIELKTRTGADIETHYQALLRTHGDKVADRGFERAWDFAGRRPLTCQAKELRAQMDDLVRSVETKHWKGETGLLMRRVLLAHIQRCSHACQSIYHLAERSGAELAQCHRDTFNSKTKQLCELGLIERQTSSLSSGQRRLKPTSAYQLVGAEILRYQPWTYPLNGSPCPKVEKNIDVKALTETDRYHGVFERDGLGRSCERVWLCLEGQSLLPQEIHEQVGLSLGTIYRSLKKLDACNLVSKGEGRYTTVSEPDFKRVSRHLGTGSKALRRRNRHERQRNAYKGRNSPDSTQHNVRNQEDARQEQL